MLLACRFHLTHTHLVLVDAVGIRFGTSTKEIAREVLEGVVDEADRETFTANIKS